ncbi:MAG: PDZ domain-containing protein [Zetaproteobacteria bacterium]|nr:MAG: PDZ domain-containing protein [Zetaproteobacteria bacterium]
MVAIQTLRRQEWWLQRAPAALEVALVVWIAWQCAVLLVPSGTRRDGADLPAAPQAERTAVGSIDPAAIVAQHLFGKPQAKPKAAPKPRPVAPPPPPPVVKPPIRLDAKLVGTAMAGDRSVAMILPMPGKAVDTFHVGDAVIPRVTVQRIYADHVVLDADGTPRELWLDKKAEAAAKGMPPPPPLVRQLPSRSPNRRNMGLSRQVVNDAMANFSRLLSQARILPHFTNGKADGFLVTDIAAGSLYQRLGLQNGDILTGVNGKPVTSMEQAMNMYRQLQTASSVDVTVRRGGSDYVFHYEIR